MTRLVNFKVKEKCQLQDIQGVFTSTEFKSELIKAFNSRIVARPAFKACDVERMTLALGRFLFKQAREAQRLNRDRRAYTLSALNIPVHELRSSILAMAYYGLDLTPERGHVYFVPMVSELTGDIQLATILGVKGMSNLMSRAFGVRGVEARCVYEDDTFQFNGNFEKPIFSRSTFNGESRSEDKIVGGYFLLHYDDEQRSVFCSDISGNRLHDMAREARERYLDVEGNPFDPNHAWFTSHKEVMFDHLVMRHGFREVSDKTDLFALTLDDSGQVVDVRMDAVEDKSNDEFSQTMKEFSQALAKADAGVVVGQ